MPCTACPTADGPPETAIGVLCPASRKPPNNIPIRAPGLSLSVALGLRPRPIQLGDYFPGFYAADGKLTAAVVAGFAVVLIPILAVVAVRRYRVAANTNDTVDTATNTVTATIHVGQPTAVL
jgi:hypothetical protein